MGRVLDFSNLPPVPTPPCPEPGHPSVAAELQAREDRKEQGDWLPACGGTETAFTTRTGRRLLYCWQPATGRHAYLDLDGDLILSDAEAVAALGMF